MGLCTVEETGVFTAGQTGRVFMTQFLLVHGAFHGAWCWQKLVAELEKRGHRAKAIDLPGQGEDQTPLKEVTLDTMVDKIIAEMADLPGKVVLLGHSLGGIPITVTGEKVPDRIKALVYLSAFLPRDGEALLDIENRNPKPVVPVSMTFDAERISGTIMADKVRDIFYHDCSDTDIADAKARLRPQALAALMTKVHMTPERFGRIPRVYVECTEDRALSIEMQRDMISKSPPVDVRSLPASHSPFLSRPEKLADALADL
jgi:pimeloyl-ACP methyl ester carboxylesterase